MLIIEILKIIASLSITLALFYTFYKAGRQSAYDDLLKHFFVNLDCYGLLADSLYGIFKMLEDFVASTQSANFKERIE